MKQFILFLLLTSTPALAREGDELLGTRLSGFPPSSISVGGKVVLIRFFSDRCPYCRKTIPLLNQWQHRYRKAGLQVIGIYHPKPSPRAVSAVQLKQITRDLKIDFPIVNDCQWQLLEKWWFQGKERDYTSASLLLDRNQRVAAVHPGGEYHDLERGDDPSEHAECRREAERIRQKLETLLKAQRPATHSSRF